MSEKQNAIITERDEAQLRCMLRGAGELAECFEKCGKETSDPQLRDEFQKLAAASRNHQNILSELIGGESAQ